MYMLSHYYTNVSLNLCAEPSDASVPKPSLRSTSSGSLASLTPPTNTTGTGAQQQNADEAHSEVPPAGEEDDDDLGEDESAFDEEGILFGDSELISVPLQQLLKHAIATCNLSGQTVNKVNQYYIIVYLPC